MGSDLRNSKRGKRRLSPATGVSSACRSRYRLLAAALTLLCGVALAPAAQARGPAAHMTLTLSPPLISADGSSQTTATATITDASGGPVRGEVVAISSSDFRQAISPEPATDNGDGTYTATITSSSTPGASTISATDVTTAQVAPASATLTQYGQASNVSIVSIAPAAIPANGASSAAVTAYATDSVGDPVPGDSVAFSSNDPGQTISGITNNGDGTYRATITASTTVGTASIVATDDSVGPAVVSGPALLTQTASSGTTLSILPSSMVSTNELLTLIAAVAGSPSGTITFYNGYAPIANCQGLSVSSSNPVAVCEISFAASASPVGVTAAFVPANGATGGSSQSQTVDVIAGSTTTSIRASNPSARVGRAVTYTASVTPSNQGPAIPGGSVKFIQGGKPLARCSSVGLQASGGALSASCTLRYTTPGIRQVTATYSGNQDFGGSTSSSIPVAVQALGRISSSMLWAFRYTPSYTTIASMSVNGVSLGTKVIVTCKGHGCPFARRVSAPSGGVRCTGTGKHRCGKGPIALAGAFHRNRLVVGTRITVEIRRPGWIGKFYSFVVVSRQTPQVRISCLAPGLSKPGIDC